MKPQIEQLTLGSDPAAWRDAGFSVDADGMWVGTVPLQFGSGEGIIGWRAELLGERLGSIRDAVQPGRRTATVRKSAGLGLPVALISAPIARAS